MNPRFANIVRLLAVAAFAAGACGARAAAAADAPAPGGVLALQAEFPERKFPELQEILRQGLVNGPSVLISQWNAAAAAQDAKGAGGRASLLPSLGGGASVGQTYEQYRSGGVSSNNSMTAVLYNLGLSQPVYAWDSLTNSYQIRKLQQAVAERNIGEVRRGLAIDIRRRYFDIVLMAGVLDLARKNLERLERDRKETEQAIADGTQAAGAIDGPNRSIQIAKPEIMRLENELAALRQGLAQLTGLPEAVIDKIPAEIPALPDLHEALQALSAGEKPPPSTQLQNLAAAASIERLNYAITKKRLYPRLGVALSVDQQNRTANNTSVGPRYLYTTWGAYATVNWTLFDGLATQAAKRASIERMKIAEAGRSQAEKQEGAERRMEVARLLVQWEQLQNTERDLARTRAGMIVTEQDFKNGTASARQAEDARMAYLSALQNPYGAQAARANFYIALVSCLSNRGQDPVIMAVQQ